MGCTSLLLLLASPVAAAEPKVHADIPYVAPKNERQTLDVYAPAEGKDHPVVVWIHGGGWKAGDKKSVQKKPQAFVDRGFVFVAINYRFVPNVTVKEMTGDVARALRWVHDHIADYGGDPKTLFVMGHSAGAHLAALVCSDDRYLKAEQLSLSLVKGCVPVDVSVYDIPRRLKDGGAVSPATFKAVFGETEEGQRDLSPAAHVARGKNIPPFLILHVADRPDTRAQSAGFAEKLNEAGVWARVVAAEGKTHGTINSELGLPDDKPTLAVFEFLKAAVSSAELVENLKKLGARITLDEEKRVVGVHLGERKVTDADLVHLKGLYHLQELDLTRTRITSAGLANLQDLAGLRKVFLTDTKVDDAGIAHLKGLKSLEVLGLSGTRFGDGGLGHLEGLTGLKQVFCIGTGVTAAGAAQLQKKLPKCQVAN